MRVSRVVPAEFGRRLGAFLIDTILIASIPNCLLLTPFVFTALITVMVPTSNIGTPYENLDPQIAESPAVRILFFALSLVIFWLYSALLESSKWQATIGKRVLGLYVADESGVRISFKRATLRAIVKFFGSSLCGIGNLISFGMVLLTDKHQGIHDILAHTLVLAQEIEMPQIFIDQRQYNVEGKNIVVTGDNPALNNVQLGDTTATPNWAGFVEELSRLRIKIQEQPPSNEKDIADAILRAAEDEAKKGNAPKMREHLARLGKDIGKWVTSFAVDVGANLVAEALIKSINI